MERVLQGLKPERVFYYFEELCKIPHGSYNVQMISDYCLNLARGMGMEARQDEELNVVIRVPAFPGYEDAPAVMIQGHMDMVAVKDPDVEKDMLTEGLDLIVDGDYVRAKGTSLGGDDCIAVAMALAIMEDRSLPHPELELVFTTQEEVGMDGMHALDTSDLHARYLLNLDSEEEGHFLAGCAGGVRANAEFETRRVPVTGQQVQIAISGLAGGHSGTEIDKCRANAIVLAGRVLFDLHEEVQLHLVSIEGGEKDNAIPLACTMTLIIDPEDLPQLESRLSAIAADIAAEYRTSDPGLQIRIRVCDEAETDGSVLHPAAFEKLILLLMEMPNGIQTMSADLPGLVESSLNAGIIRTEEDVIRISWAIRSSVKSLKTLISSKLEYLTEFLGGEITFKGSYPEWTFNPQSPICGLCCRLYEAQTGRKAVISTMHAGVECGLLGEKMPSLDMVSMGPDLLDIHTTSEHMSIASVERCYRLVLAVLEAIRGEI